MDLIGEIKSDDCEDSSSAESMDEDDDIDDAAIMKQLSELEKLLDENIYNYQAHVDKINLLQKAVDLDKLRKARTIFSKYYPLSPELWLPWLKDEGKLAMSIEEKKHVISLFEKSLNDYLSVEIWLEYCQFAMGLMAEEDGILKVRSVFDRALTSAGLHVSKGSLIWEAYREFENVILSLQNPAPGTVQTSEQLQSFEVQWKKIDSLFRRQLRLPLLNIKETFNEYKEWLNDKQMDTIVEKDYEKALKNLEQIYEFETTLLGADKFTAYQKYIEFEEKEGNPARIQCLYERAMTDCCLNSELWKNYVNYLESNLKIKDISLSVYKRAVRNCPWDVEIWCQYLISMEKYEEAHSDIKVIFEEALNSGFHEPSLYKELWVTYCTYLRRHIDWQGESKNALEELQGTFSRASTHLSSISGDENCEILFYWARFEAKYCRNMEQARKLINEIINSVDFTTSKIWISLIDIEKYYGDEKHLKKLFIRAMDKVTIDPEVIGSLWLQYERENGTLDSYEYCLSRCKTKYLKFYEQQAIKQKLEEENNKRVKEKIERKKEKDKDFRKEKRKALSNQKAEFQNEFKKPKFDSNYSQKNEISNSSSNSTVDSKEVVKDEKTVFLSNLAYTLEEDEIKMALSLSGKVIDVRLVKNFHGKSKGFAYVQFETVDEAQEALKRDRELLHGRPMFISKCDADRPKKEFKYNSGLEKNKLFVKNLSFNTKKEKLEEIFKKYGVVKDVRLVTNRSGSSKGLAFVDFENETDAAKALINVDGMDVDGKIISVDLSNPPARKPQNQPSFSDKNARPPYSDKNVRSLGGGAKEFGPRGKGNTQLAFVPRAINKSGAGSSSTLLKPVKFIKPNTNGKEDSDKREAAPKKSNEDFRKMMFGSK